MNQDEITDDMVEKAVALRIEWAQATEKLAAGLLEIGLEPPAGCFYHLAHSGYAAVEMHEAAGRCLDMANRLGFQP